MASYFLINFDVINPQLFEQYVGKVVPIVISHGGAILVADFQAVEVEGKRKNFNLVIKFDSDEQAMGWYNDPEYANNVRPMRWESTINSYVVLTHEFTGM